MHLTICDLAVVRIQYVSPSLIDGLDIAVPSGYTTRIRWPVFLDEASHSVVHVVTFLGDDSFCRFLK